MDVTVSLPGPLLAGETVVVVPLDGLNVAVLPTVIEKLELTRPKLVPSAAKQVYKGMVVGGLLLIVAVEASVVQSACEVRR